MDQSKTGSSVAQPASLVSWERVMLLFFVFSSLTFATTSSSNTILYFLTQSFLYINATLRVVSWFFRSSPLTTMRHVPSMCNSFDLINSLQTNFNYPSFVDFLSGNLAFSLFESSSLCSSSLFLRITKVLESDAQVLSPME